VPTIEYTDLGYSCHCCGSEFTIGNDEDLTTCWISTLAFVALRVVDIEDADAGLTICQACAERIIGSEWRTLGKWQADKFKALVQLEHMLRGEPYFTVH
jgi:hypothetical protein